MLVYPFPNKMTETDGKFVFSKNLKLVINETFKYKRTATLFEELWNNFTFGYSTLALEFSKNIPEHTMRIGSGTAVLEADREHAISITENGIAAAAEDEIGLIHAFATILQMITPMSFEKGNESFYINGCEIQDKPALEFRGMHLAVTRNNINIIRKCVRLCGLMKHSYIMFEFFGSLKFDCMKELAFDDAYTKEDFAPIIEEAHAWGMEIIPMFNHLGHAACAKNQDGHHVVLTNAPEKALLFEPDGWTYCVSNPETIELQKKIRRELIELCGEGKYFHAGGDEAYSFGTCDVCSKKDSAKLFAEFFNDIAEDMKQFGRRVMIWGDTLLDFEWNRKYDIFGHKYEGTVGTGKDTHNAVKYLDRSIIVTDWQYTIWDEDVLTSKHLKNLGFDVIPASGCEEVKNTDALTQAAKKEGYAGVLQTVWTAEFPYILIVRIGTDCWSDSIASIIREGDNPDGGHKFIRQYMLMNDNTGRLIRAMMPKGDNTMTL